MSPALANPAPASLRAVSAASEKPRLKVSFQVESKLERFYSGGRVAVSQDGAFAACPCGDFVKVVDLASAAVTATFKGDTEAILAVAVSPDGRHVFASSRSLLTRWWDRESEVCKRSWKAHEQPVLDLAVDSSGHLLATASVDRTTRVWDVEKGYCTHSFKGHTAIVNRVVFHPDPHRLQLFTGSDDATVRVWDLVTRSCAAVLKSHFSAVTDLAVARDGWTLLSAARDKVVNAWDLRKNTLKSTVPVFEALEGIAEAPELLLDLSVKSKAAHGKANAVNFLAVGEKGQVRLYSTETAESLYEFDDAALAGAGGLLQVFAFGKSREVLCVTADQRLVFLQVREGRLQVVRQLIGNNDDIIDMKFAGSDDQYLAVATNSEQVRLYDATTHACMKSLPGHTDIVLSLDVCPAISSRLRLATGSKDNTVRVWNAEDNKCIALATGHVAAVGAVAFSRKTAAYLASGSSDKTLKLWDLSPLDKYTGGQPLKLKPLAIASAHEKDINSIAIAPNDSLLCSASQDRTVKLWKLPELQLKLTLRGHKRGVWCCEFSPVDKVVVTSSGDQTIKIWSISDGACIRTLEGHTASVLKVSFMSLGTQLISAGADGLLKLWTLRTNECVATLDGHEDKVWALAVRRDEAHIASGGGDATINVWVDTTQEEEEAARASDEKQVLMEQDLANALTQADYAKAVKYAFELQKPFRLLKVLGDVVKDPEGDRMLENIIAMFDASRLQTCLQYMREWNTNAKFCHTAQHVLHVMLTAVRPEILLQVPNIKELLEGVLPYTQRHYARIQRLVQSTFLLDYTLAAMSVLLPAGNAVEEASNVQQVSADRVGRLTMTDVLEAVPADQRQKADANGHVEAEERPAADTADGVHDSDTVEAKGKTSRRKKKKRTTDAVESEVAPADEAGGEDNAAAAGRGGQGEEPIEEGLERKSKKQAKRRRSAMLKAPALTDALAAVQETPVGRSSKRRKRMTDNPG
eukprot:jgi/Chlat1/8301/Chrsp78S07720